MCVCFSFYQKFGKNKNMTSTSSAITSIPILQRVFLFGTGSIKHLTSYSHVTSSWEDCAKNYSSGIFESWLNPTDETILNHIRTQSESTALRKTVYKSASADSNDDTTTTTNQQQTAERDPSVIRAEAKGTLYHAYRRRISGGLVRACNHGMRWLIKNIIVDDKTAFPLLAKEFSDPAKCSHYSGIPIFGAVSGKHHDIVRFLIARNPRCIDACDLNQRTPLFAAAKNEDLEMMDILLEAGADINCKDYGSRDIFDLCAGVGCVKSMEHLFRKFPAAKATRLESDCKIQLHKNNSVNSDYAYSLMDHCASMATVIPQESEKMIRFLTDQGFYVNQKTLYLAAKSINPAVVEAVIDGAKKMTSSLVFWKNEDFDVGRLLDTNRVVASEAKVQLVRDVMARGQKELV